MPLAEGANVCEDNDTEYLPLVSFETDVVELPLLPLIVVVPTFILLELPAVI